MTKQKLAVYIGIIALTAVALGFFMMQTRVDAPRSSTQNKLVENNPQALEIHSECEIIPVRSEIFDCYAKAFDEDIKQNGARHTLELLDQLQRQGGYALQECHPLVHKVGNLAYHHYGSVLAAAGEFNPVCQSGFYHGLLEEYLGQAEDYEVGLKTACGSYNKDGYFDWFQCTHGIGHGVMQHRENDIFKSVNDCDLLNPAGNAPEICYGGVFMENITTEAKTGHASKFTKADNPIYPCDVVSAKYKNACYFLSSSMILKLNNYDFQDAFKTCETKAEENYKWLCYQSLGRDVSGSTIRDNQKVRQLCLYGNEAGRNECFFGAARDYVNEKGEFDTAIQLCNFIPDAYQAKCFDAIFLDLGFYKTGQEYLSVCARMPEQFRGSCEIKVKYD